MKYLKSAILAIFTCAVPALAQEYGDGDLKIEHPYAFTTPATAQTGAGYLTITNTGTTDDRITGVEADFPRVMLHTTVRNDNVASMPHMEAIDLPAGETVAFEPGGFHIMFMGLNGDPFEPDEEIPATLVFEHADPIEILFKVESRAPEAPTHTKNN